jgi:uncharacterized protein (TIGR00730 family)
MTALCIFAGASSGNNQLFIDQASELGQRLARRGYDLVYGGGRTGMMGAFADGAISAGGQVTGIIPQFLEDREISHTDVSQLIITNSMHERKARMYQGASGFVILPGGLGTLDETMEVMTWIQLRLLKAEIFILDLDEYWQPLTGMLEHIVARGFMHSAKLDFVHWAKEARELEKLLERRCPAS